MKRILTALLAFIPVLALAGEKPTPAAFPPAGEYKCYVLAMGGSIATPYGAAPMVTPMPSAVNQIRLDGKNGYKHASGSGKYRYDASTGRVMIESGPFTGWTIRSETDGKAQWLRFAEKKGAMLAPTSRIGDHICSIG
jgi:hypothetical protein